jgi:hypothetical protein
MHVSSELSELTGACCYMREDFAHTDREHVYIFSKLLLWQSGQIAVVPESSTLLVTQYELNDRVTSS